MSLQRLSEGRCADRRTRRSSGRVLNIVGPATANARRLILPRYRKCAVQFQCRSEFNSARSVLQMGSCVSVVSGAALMQKIWNRTVLVDCCSRTHCCTVIFCDFTIRFSITGLQHARCEVLRAAWYRWYSRLYLRRLTVFCTATIYRGISWPWRYWYRHVGIDDKYRGIAQHYYAGCIMYSSLQQSK